VTRDRWRRLRVALEAAVEVPPHRVESVLSSVCAHDPSLIAEARSMLRAADSARGLLESPPFSSDPLSTPAQGRERSPSGTALLAPRGLQPALQQNLPGRLKIAARFLAVLIIGALLLNFALRPAGLVSTTHPWFHTTVGLLMIAISAAVVWSTEQQRISPERLVTVGLAYEVLVAFGIALMDNVAPHSVSRPLDEISWMCVWIVMFPLAVPAPPRKTLLAGVGAATTWPLAFLVGLFLGNPAPPAGVIALNFIEGYIAAGLALIPTMIVRSLHADAEAARRMGSYELVKELGHGGMGEVWEARHDMLARPAAIKLIRPKVLGIEPDRAHTLLERFEREAQATAALHSPHTVELYDFGVTPSGTFYYVMELLDGLDLEQLVRRFGPVPAERAVHFLLQMCDSLEDAHVAGLVHRDIKPANVYACRRGRKRDFVKVLDFGLVKPAWTTEPHERSLTGQGAIAGTPAYLAPELALGNRAIDGRADIYALGCVAYWLVTAQRVFEAESPLQLVVHHIETTPVPPSQRGGSSVPADLDELILWCLQKTPEKRPADVTEVARHLANCRLDARWTPERAAAWWKENLGS
jgi:serine/threonine-protein kinase